MTAKRNIEEINELEELIKIGKELAEKKEYDEAIKFIQKALVINPDDLNTLNTMGFANGRKGDYPEAIKYYKKALAIEPQFQKALGNIGHVYEMMEEYDLAIDFYKRSLEAKAENENLRFPDNIIPIIKDHLKKARELAKK